MTSSRASYVTYTSGVRNFRFPSVHKIRIWNVKHLAFRMKWNGDMSRRMVQTILVKIRSQNMFLLLDLITWNLLLFSSPDQKSQT